MSRCSFRHFVSMSYVHNLDELFVPVVTRQCYYFCLQRTVCGFSGITMQTRHYDIDDYRYIHRPMD
jgi:hypothetical protein